MLMYYCLAYYISIQLQLVNTHTFIISLKPDTTAEDEFLFPMSSTSVVVDCDETLIGKVCPAVGKSVDNELETTFVGVFEGIDVIGVVAVDNVVGEEVILGCKVGDGVVSDGD